MRALLIFFIVAIAATSAHAQQAPAAIDLRPLWEIGLGLLSVVGSAVIALATMYARRWINNAEADDAIKRLESGMRNGLQLAIAELATYDISKVNVQDAILARAAGYVARTVPDAAKLAMGADPTTIEGQRLLQERLMARLAPAVTFATAVDGAVSVATAATAVNPNVPTVSPDVAAKPAAASPPVPAPPPAQRRLGGKT